MILRSVSPLYWVEYPNPETGAVTMMLVLQLNVFIIVPHSGANSVKLAMNTYHCTIRSIVLSI